MLLAGEGHPAWKLDGKKATASKLRPFLKRRARHYKYVLSPQFSCSNECAPLTSTQAFLRTFSTPVGRRFRWQAPCRLVGLHRGKPVLFARLERWKLARASFCCHRSGIAREKHGLFGLTRNLRLGEEIAVDLLRAEAEASARGRPARRFKLPLFGARQLVTPEG